METLYGKVYHVGILELVTTKESKVTVLLRPPHPTVVIKVKYLFV